LKRDNEYTKKPLAFNIDPDRACFEHGIRAVTSVGWHKFNGYLFSNDGDPAGEMIGSFAFGFELIVLLFCSWFVLKKVMGREQAELPFRFPFASWQIFAVIGMVVLSVALGGVIAYMEITWLAWFTLPALTVFVIVPPIWLFRLQQTALSLARWRIFSILGLG
jgi:hypothetical protein